MPPNLNMPNARVLARGVLVFHFLTLAAFAHAILKESTPAVRATVHGPEVAIRLKFNARIDAGASRLYLNGPTRTQPVRITAQTSPDTLLATVTDLKPGDYQIQWQVLAMDGHITRGELPFTVK